MNFKLNTSMHHYIVRQIDLIRGLIGHALEVNIHEIKDLSVLLRLNVNYFFCMTMGRQFHQTMGR